MRTIAPALLLLLVAATASASDGVVEINQTCAQQTGCFSGDTPGFPVTIPAPGSSRLTSNLLVRSASAANRSGIVIEASHVTLDLDGFELRCEFPNLPVALPCASVGGVGDGIVASTTTSAHDVRITNGKVRNFARHGVNAAAVDRAYEIDAMQISDDGENGIGSRAFGSIWNCTPMNDGEYGINVEQSLVVLLDTLTFGNGVLGVWDGDEAVADLRIGRSVFRDGTVPSGPQTRLTCCAAGFVRICP